MENKKVVLGLAAVTVFILVVYLLPNILVQNISAQCTLDGNCLHEQQLKEYISLSPLLFALGFLLGAVAFYFFAETRKVERIEVKPDRDAVLRLLDSDERKVVSRIVDEGGRILQSEISHIEGMGKVKAHRVLDRLQQRGVVEIEGHGKTNLVKLSKDLQNVFL